MVLIVVLIVEERQLEEKVCGALEKGDWKESRNNKGCLPCLGLSDR